MYLPRQSLTLDSYKADLPPSKPTIEGLSDTHTTETFPLLVRATDGDKFKISTVVSQEGLEDFFGKYGEICKSGMQGLKKRDRKKEKAKKDKKKDKKSVV
jgi:signal recognition particle subunit SRP14